MRIAQVAPLAERVPPSRYGGIELVVALLTDELVRRGHEVTLFASGDSETLAHLESVHPRATRTDPSVRDYHLYLSLQLSRVYQQSENFDIIHSHVDYPAFSYADFFKTPTVHTLHGQFTEENKRIFAQAKAHNFVSISNSQREPMPDLNYVATVYNGIDVNQYEFHRQPDEEPYLAFLGRVSPEKGPHLAIEIAKKTGWKLKMSCKVDDVDREFFETVVKPQVDGEQIQLTGEISQEEKSQLIGGAVATLFPITWREPFGLVMTESMASGTPVIGMAMGAAPEVIVNGKTGFLCQNLEEMVAAVSKVQEIDRGTCREHVLTHFTVKQMVDGYEAVYEKIMQERFSQNGYSILKPEVLAGIV